MTHFTPIKDFFSHLSAVLRLIDETQISANDRILGTDEEKAFSNKKIFSKLKRKATLCSRHLGEISRGMLKQNRNV